MVGTIELTDVGDDLNDMISALPEGVLLHILSLLPTKDAVRTSVLATKWKHLWKYLSAFHFENVDPRYESTHQNQNAANCLLDLVGRLLDKSNKIERLSVEIFRISVDRNKVSYLISSAMKHKIQYLRLSLGDSNDQFMLPHSFSTFTSLNELWLGLEFTLHVPSGICFPCLKKLVVSNATFANENSVQQLFSGCPVLEELDLDDCYWENIEQVNVAISTLRILRIRSNMLCVAYEHDITLKIDAVNLLTLYCRCIPTIEFIPVNLTSLVDAYIDLWCGFPHSKQYVAHCAFKLLRGLNSIKSLTMCSTTLQCLYHTKNTLHLLPLFHNLTHLNVCCLTSKNTNEVLLNILRKTPKLKVLTIPGVVLNNMDSEDLMLNSVPCCFKYSLNQLCFSYFNGDEHAIKFIMFILNNSPHLEEVKIYCSRLLLADKEKMTDVWNRLEDACAERCANKFIDNNTESSDDDEDEQD